MSKSAAEREVRGHAGEFRVASVMSAKYICGIDDGRCSELGYSVGRKEMAQ